MNPLIDRLSEWGIEFCKYRKAVCKKGETGFTLDVSNTIGTKTDDASYILTFYKKGLQEIERDGGNFVSFI